MLTAVVNPSRITATAHGETVTVAVVESTVQTTASGGVGPPGSASLSGMTDVSVTAPAAGDVLRHDGSLWRNYPEDNLVDGGNF